MSAPKRLSVVLTIVDGGEALAECLSALTTQLAPPPLDVIVPYDDSVEGIDALAKAFPGVRFLAMGRVPTERPVRTPGGQHELFDRVRGRNERAYGGGFGQGFVPGQTTLGHAKDDA